MGIIESLIIVLVILFLLGLIMHLLIWLTWPFLILAAILLIVKLLRKTFRKITK